MTENQDLSHPPSASPQRLSRWRLILGKYAQPHMPNCLSDVQQHMDGTLEQLYARAYQGRGVRQDAKVTPGTLDPSQLNVPQWLHSVRELFPRDVCDIITQHALERYGMTELVQDPDVLASLSPSTELLSAVLSLKGEMDARVLSEVRRLVARVVEEIKRRLEHEIQNAFAGRLNRFRHSQLRVARNFDARETIRRNLKHWNAERQQLLVEQPRSASLALGRHLVHRSIRVHGE